ncbi:MAG TPA: FecR domain-containing protein [Syntrophales bacterium]|nr:FecR domain-containing protein [Syntrophales bacterium]
MSKCRAVGVFIGIAALIFLLAAGADAAGEKFLTVKMGSGEAKVVFLKGAATVTPSGQKTGRALQEGDSLKAGDQVVTGADTLLEILLPDRSMMRFGDRTNFKIVQIYIDSGKKAREVKVHMNSGKTWNNIRKTFFGVKPKIEVTTLTSVCGVRGTVYRMNVENDQSVLVRVYSGEVGVWSGAPMVEEGDKPGVLKAPKAVSGPKPVAGPRKVTMEEWVYIVKSMEQIRVSSQGVPAKPEEFSEQEDRDPWVDWNKARDQEAGKVPDLQ